MKYFIKPNACRPGEFLIYRYYRGRLEYWCVDEWIESSSYYSLESFLDTEEVQTIAIDAIKRRFPEVDI